MEMNVATCDPSAQARVGFAFIQVEWEGAFPLCHGERDIIKKRERNGGSARGLLFLISPHEIRVDEIAQVDIYSPVVAAQAHKPGST